LKQNTNDREKCVYVRARARPWAQNCNWKKERSNNENGRASGDDRKRAIMGLSPYITHCRRHSSFQIGHLFDLFFCSITLTLVLTIFD